MMKKEDLQKLIDRYLNDDCSAEEIAAVHRWYNSFEQDPNPVDVLSREQQQQLKRRLMNRIKANIASLDSAQEQSDLKKYHYRTLIYTISGVAAMLILVLGIFFSRQNPSHSQHTTADNRIVINKTKRIQKLLLADGSIVWLSPQTSISYPRKFSRDRRDVQMHGEAFFEVFRDTKRPFIIHSDNVITKVLGTSFRVRAYADVPVEVSVVTGKVSVQLEKVKNTEVMLLPHQKAVYLRGAKSLKKDIEQKTSVMRMWQKATLSFDNASIRTVIKTLNKEFGVKINSGDEELLSYTLNADFTARSLPSILEMLGKSLNIVYEIKGTEIILSDKNNKVSVNK